MLPPLEIIQEKRRRLGLTQSQLAELAGVSQSYIAKLEARSLEPAYGKVRAILEALEGLETRREVPASELMTGEVVGVGALQPIQEAVDLMRMHGYSQLPVMDGGRAVGSISESTILERLLAGDSDGPPSEGPVSEVMDDPFPQVGEEAPVSVLTSLLRIYPAVLVQRKGEVVGIVTKADLLGTIS